MIFYSGFLHWWNIKRPDTPIVRLFSIFDFVLEFANLFKCLTFDGDSVDTQSLIPHQLSQPQVRLRVAWDSTSTESTRNDEIFLNVGAFCIGSVDVESHSALTQLTEVSLSVDSVDGESHSVLTNLTGSLTPHRLRARKMNQAKNRHT